MQDGMTQPAQGGGTSDYPSLVASWVAEIIPELEVALQNGTLEQVVDRPDVQEVIGQTLVERGRHTR
jgi:hypothetical protein